MSTQTDTAQTDYARRLFPEQMAARRYARDEAALAAESPPQVYAPPLYYSAPAPYQDALEYAFWKAQFAASVREKAEPLRYTLHDHNLERVQENVRAFLASVDTLLAPLTAQEALEERPSAPQLVPPSEIPEAEQQALEDWKAAQRNACSLQGQRVAARLGGTVPQKAEALGQSQARVAEMLRFNAMDQRFWVGVLKWILVAVAVLVFRNLPVIRDWEVWR